MSRRIDVEELKRRVDLAVLVGGVVALKKKGRDWWGLCPLHAERTPSFKVSGQGWWKCFGCSEGGDALSFLMKTQGLKFIEAAHELARFAGLDTALAIDADPARAQERERRQREREQLEACEAAQRANSALAVWKVARAAAGTMTHRYLQARGIRLDPPASLRHHPALLETHTGVHFPAMVACMQDAETGRFNGIHRTYIAFGAPVKAPLSSPKKMLGRAAGSVVRFGPPARHLVLAEGIETALSVMQAMGEGAGAWAALSLGNLGRVIFPDVVEEVLVAADNDFADPKGAVAIIERAAAAHAARGLKVKVAWPARGMDFNDMLRRGAGAA